MYFDWRLFTMTRGLRQRIALAMAIGLVAVPVAIWRLTLTGQTIAQVFQGAPIVSLVPTFVLIGGLVLLRAALQFAKEDVANGTAARMKVRLRKLLYEQVLCLGPGYFDQRRTGDSMLSLVDGVEQLDVFFGQYLPQLVVAVFAPAIIFATMAFMDVVTATIFLVFALATLVAPALFHRMNRHSSLAHRRDQATVSAEFLDSIQGLATLKAFGQSKQRGARLAERARQLYRTTMWVIAANLTTGAVTMLGVSAGAAVALAVGAVRVENGTLELRTLLVVLLLGVEVFRPLRELVQLYHSGMMAMAATVGIYGILDATPEVRDAATEDVGIFRQPDATAGSPRPACVTFENVTFSYGRGRAPALRDCSLELRPGETLGIVGRSGAGKSTVVNLILRFVDPQAGRVLMGGRDIRELPLDTIRRQVAVVAQDTYLFYGTVAENLRLGKPSATRAELEAAARAANGHDFIAALPHGYETMVGERGARLSGGQRQRIAIARALLRDAPILILDEATSSVDAENEAAIQQALERLQRGRTTLVIAHRLSSVMHADRIIVLDRGRLVETGTSDELLRHRDGVYAQLMAAQQVVEVERSADAGTPSVAAAETRWLADAGTTADRSPAAPRARRETVDGSISGPARPGVSASEVWRRLLRLVRPWWWESALTVVFGLLHASSTVLLGVFGALLVGRVVTGQPLQPWLTVLLTMVPITALLRWLDSWISHDLAYRLLAELRIRLYQLLDPLAPAYLLGRRSGDLASTAVSDVDLIELFYAHTISPLVVAIVVPGSVLVALAVIAPPLAIVLVPFLFAVAGTPLLAARQMEHLGVRLRDVSGNVNAFVVDSIQGLRTIAAFAYGGPRVVEMVSHSQELSDLKRDFLRWQAIQNATIEALMGLGGLAVLTVGASLVAGGQMSRPALPLATVVAMASFQPIVNIVTVAKELMQTLAAARRFFAIEDEPVSVRDGPGVELPAAANGRHGDSVRFDSVTFRYGPHLPPAVTSASFDVGASQTVALVGRSGAGKSTIAHLLLRFWDPQSGRVLIGGHDVRHFNLDELRRRVALVAQDTYLFNASLAENLRLGRSDASGAEVLDAARRANVDEFASALPDGYDTLVGERGMQLSGGQRQRVAIARAMLKDAPVLVLDEATSHLDAVNEAEVRQALDRLMTGRTTLVIAHRLSTIREADWIVVLDDGAVVEQGRHGDLLALDGLYSHLIGMQPSNRGLAAATERASDGRFDADWGVPVREGDRDKP